ncbi:hypothetical protein LAWASA_3244 [Lawsonibacter asaccharolyticus]|nr:hypothetical protein LAWASA_3244 [Lawsonibacter asaccharolyticus]
MILDDFWETIFCMAVQLSMDLPHSFTVKYAKSGCKKGSAGNFAAAGMVRDRHNFWAETSTEGFLPTHSTPAF